MQQKVSSMKGPAARAGVAARMIPPSSSPDPQAAALNSAKRGSGRRCLASRRSPWNASTARPRLSSARAASSAGSQPPAASGARRIPQSRPTTPRLISAGSRPRR